jgi:hypothetical protein
VRGEDDGRLFHGRDVVDRPHAELFHLLHDALVVHELPEDRATATGGGEALHREVGDAHAGTEAILLRSLDLHGPCAHDAQPPAGATRTLYHDKYLHTAKDRIAVIAISRPLSKTCITEAVAMPV